MNTFDRLSFDRNGMCIIRLTDWLDAACRDDKAGDFPTIVLPMIQRGSVWKPHQVMDLWDTLLRGLPVGSMIAGMAKPGQYFTPIKRELRDVGLNQGLSLIDGQQRTLSMLVGWPRVRGVMNRRIWVDLGMDDRHDHLFRFHFTTEFHPFGYEFAGPSGSAVAKLSRDYRRRALAIFEAIHGELPKQADQFEQRRKLLWEKAVPWHGVIPINLQDILDVAELGKQSLANLFERRRDEIRTNLEKAREHFQQDNSDDFVKIIDGKIAEIERIGQERQKLTDRIERLKQAIVAFRGLNMPLIRVPDSAFTSDNENDEIDPVLAVLFQRIGTGGTPLTNADYVYSILKHHVAECHSLVEAMLDAKKDMNRAVAALFEPVTLVCSAVRLTAAQMGERDHARIDKSQFAKLMRVEKFTEKFKENIRGDGLFSRHLIHLLEVLRYRKDTIGDIGFPIHALPLLNLPVLEVLLLWFLEREPGGITDESRSRLIRFVLYCRLAITGDHARASELMFTEIKRLKEEGRLHDFPEKELVQALHEKALALPMRSPDYYYENLKQVISSPDPTDDKILRGEERFSLPDQPSEERRKAIDLYRRFWEPRTHRHEILLWIQRRYVFEKFEGSPALPGSEDETPYDYDHICPQSYWSDWTGSGGDPTALLNFRSDAYAERVLGNSIGNVRAWDSSQNRSDGDSSPINKMAEEADRRLFLAGDYGDKDEVEAWRACLKVGDKGPRQWDDQRAKAFQRAIERRTFNLFKRMHDDLAFSDYEGWLSQAVASSGNFPTSQTR